MAGIEQLEIHSKSYIVRWVKVDEGHTVSWSVQPHKKSINFGIVKHPGSGAANLVSQALDGSIDALEVQPSGSATAEAALDNKNSRAAKKDSSTAREQLAKKGFTTLKWYGKCEADKVSIGTYDVTKAGTYGLVFDNTFSKQTSKHATFVLLTYPTGLPPQTAHPLPNLQAGASAASASKTSLGKYNSPRLGATASESLDSLHSHPPGGRALSITGRSESSSPSSYHVGLLLKRRRKKGQGYARRFFSLDFATCTLSYYHNRQSSALRGAIPLGLAAIAADEKRREISIDSGAEVWHLKASTAKDFNDWARALERASRIARGVEAQVQESMPEAAQTPHRPMVANTQQEEDREWQQVEALVSRIVGTRDALRRLVKDMAVQKHAHSTTSTFLSPNGSAVSEDSDSYFPHAQEKRSFWKRKSSAASSPLTPHAFQPALASALAVPSNTVATVTSSGNNRKSKHVVLDERGTHDHCTALLGDLDSVVSQFSELLLSSKRRRIPTSVPAAPRHSYESTSTEEFFDAEAGDVDRSQLMVLNHQSEEETPASEAEDVDAIHDSSSVSSIDDHDDTFSPTSEGIGTLFPAKPKSLTPLPINEVITRRTTIPPATIPPPSLIAFVRKNVGKDLSTISMPVSANEPTSLLQRMAEQLEYAHLLDQAASEQLPQRRLLYIAAFAISQFSSGRAKERANRKPFNPLLGETFELVRSSAEVPGGFRLLVEKVSHRPVRLAMHADGAGWSFAQSPVPTQKFWGKSAELTTEGRVRISLHLGDGTEEFYSWNVATVFLRNVVMGEKYVEPVGAMSVMNDSSGAKANVEFKSKGMFGGRGEDVQVDILEPNGSPAGLSLTGTWTSGLRTAANGDEIWRPGHLVPDAARTYGLTDFAATLNEITPLEEGKLAPTDSRLRPDQRLAESGRLDEAEILKSKLEEAQRQRRRITEENGEEYRPRWFVKAATGPDGDEVWRLKGGKDSYWEERARGTWPGVADLFAT